MFISFLICTHFVPFLKLSLLLQLEVIVVPEGNFPRVQELCKKYLALPGNPEVEFRSAKTIVEALALILEDHKATGEGNEGMKAGANGAEGQAEEKGVDPDQRI